MCPRCMTPRRTVRQWNFTCPCYRCDRTAFLSVFAFVGSTLLAQVVLTLRFVPLTRDGLVLILIERDRIYAVTYKDRTITSCFCVITVSQFVFGLYWTVFTAGEGGETLAKGYREFLPTSTPQHNRSCRSHLTLIECAFSYDTGPWKSALP